MKKLSLSRKQRENLKPYLEASSSIKIPRHTEKQRDSKTLQGGEGEHKDATFKIIINGL